MYPNNRGTMAILLMIFSVPILFPEPSSAMKYLSSMTENVFHFIENNVVIPRRELSIMSFNLEDKLVYKLCLQMLAVSKVKGLESETKSYYANVQPGEFPKDMNGRPINLNGNIVAIAPSSNSSIWPNYIDLMTKFKVNSAILVFAGCFGLDEEQLLHKLIQTLSKNSMFYLTYEFKQTQHDFFGIV